MYLTSMAQGGKQFQYGPNWRPSESVNLDSFVKGDGIQHSSVKSKPLYVRHARTDFQGRQAISPTRKMPGNAHSYDRPTTVCKDSSHLLDDLTQYRKLILKRQLSHQENMDLIKTIQKVKQISFSLQNKSKVKDTDSKRDDSTTPGRSSGCVDHSKQISSQKGENLRQLSARMKSNESLLDSFRTDFLQAFQTSLTKSIDSPEDKDGDHDSVVSKSSALTEGSTDSPSQIQVIRDGTADSGDNKGYSQARFKSTDDQNTSTLLKIHQKLVFGIKLRKWHSDSSIVTLSYRGELCLKEKQNFARVWSHSVDSLRSVTSSENPKSSSSHHIPGNSNTSSQHALIRGVSSEGCRTLDRRPERERRIRTEPPHQRLDARGFCSEDFPPVDMSLTRNGFRPGSRHPYFQKNEHPLVTTSYRYGNPREFGAPLASITGTTGGTTTLQGYRVGISSRERQNRPVPQRTGRIRNGTSYSGGTEKKGYSYTDAVPGACQAFQQRLIEIANLEGETIRYERMRKVKKKAKQDK